MFAVLLQCLSQNTASALDNAIYGNNTLSLWVWSGWPNTGQAVCILIGYVMRLFVLVHCTHGLGQLHGGSWGMHMGGGTSVNGPFTDWGGSGYGPFKYWLGESGYGPFIY